MRFGYIQACALLGKVLVILLNLIVYGCKAAAKPAGCGKADNLRLDRLLLLQVGGMIQPSYRSWRVLWTLLEDSITMPNGFYIYLSIHHSFILQAGSIVQMLRLQLLPPLAMSAIICLALGPACAGVMLLCGLAHLPGSQVSLVRHTMRFQTIAKVLAKRMLKDYRILYSDFTLGRLSNYSSLPCQPLEKLNFVTVEPSTRCSNLETLLEVS